MAILFRRLLISVLLPFLWNRWRNRRTDPAGRPTQARSPGRSGPAGLPATEPT